MWKTDMTVSVPKHDDDGNTVIKIYRIWQDRNGVLYLRSDDHFDRITDVVEAFGEVHINA